MYKTWNLCNFAQVSFFCIFPDIVLETVATCSLKQFIFIVQVDAYHPIFISITSCITQ